MATIYVNKVSKSFAFYINSKLFKRQRKYKHALNDISFELEEGEIMGLVGANGAGKTTLIKIVAGVMKADLGTVLVNGEDPFNRSIDFRNSVAIVLGQRGKLHPDMSIQETAEVYGSMYKLSPSEIDERIGGLATMLELSKDDLFKQTRTLSLGQRMKGELCLSFLNRPSIIFLDEPTLGLDVRSTRTIRNFLRNYCEEHSASAIVTSHNIGDIVETSTKLLILSRGETVFYGGMYDLPSLYNMDTKIKFVVKNRIVRDSILRRYPNAIENGAELCIMCEGNEIDSTLNSLFSCGEIFQLRVEEVPLENIIEDLLHG